MAQCKEPACQAGGPSLIPGWGRPRKEVAAQPSVLSCLGNPREAWQAAVHADAEESAVT